MFFNKPKNENLQACKFLDVFKCIHSGHVFGLYKQNAYMYIET